MGKIGLKGAFGILCDHGKGEYFPDSHFLGNRVCAHAANSLSRNATQTTGSVVASLKTDGIICWATGTSAPCTSVFKPIWSNGEVMPEVSRGVDGKFNPERLWWHHELLHRNILSDYKARIVIVSGERDGLEDSFIKKSAVVTSDTSFDFTLSSFRKSLEMTDSWIERVRAIPVRRKPGYIYRKYWESLNRKAGITNHDNSLC